MDSRLTMANMAIEAGAKNGIFPVDEICAGLPRGARFAALHGVPADRDAAYERVYEIDLGRIRPTVACPHLPANTRPAAELGDVTVDQVVIGSCTNGRIEDLRMAADMLKGRKVAHGRAAHRHPGHAGDLPPGPPTRDCSRSSSTRRRGHHADLRALPGRPHGHPGRGRAGRGHDEPQFRRPHGPPESEVYLAGPAVAAATAITGRITDPSSLGGRRKQAAPAKARARRGKKGATT